MTTACATQKVTIPDSDERSPPDFDVLLINGQPIPDSMTTDSHYILRDVALGKQLQLVAKVKDKESGVSQVTISVQIDCPDRSGYVGTHVYNKVETSTASDKTTASPGDRVYINRKGLLKFKLRDVASYCGEKLGSYQDYLFARIYVIADNYFGKQGNREYHVDLYPAR